MRFASKTTTHQFLGRFLASTHVILLAFDRFQLLRDTFDFQTELVDRFFGILLAFAQRFFLSCELYMPGLRQMSENWTP